MRYTQLISHATLEDCSLCGNMFISSHHSWSKVLSFMDLIDYSNLPYPKDVFNKDLFIPRFNCSFTLCSYFWSFIFPAIHGSFLLSSISSIYPYCVSRNVRGVGTNDLSEILVVDWLNVSFYLRSFRTLGVVYAYIMNICTGLASLEAI